MLKIIYQSIMATVILALILCGVYPLLVTGIGQLFFFDKANGSLIRNEQGAVIGSRLIGQGFAKPEYFHGRPSAAGDAGYDASNSSGSNLATTNPKFTEILNTRIEAFLKENPEVKKGEIPNELVMASGSGLDPDVSVEAIEAQIPRVAKARGISSEDLKKRVSAYEQGPAFGFLGERVVNVLELNLDLDRRK